MKSFPVEDEPKAAHAHWTSLARPAPDSRDWSSTRCRLHMAHHAWALQQSAGGGGADADGTSGMPLEPRSLSSSGICFACKAPSPFP